MFSSSSRSQRSSASTISPFRSRKSPAAPQATKRPVTPTSTVSSRPPLSRILVSPAAPPAASLSHNSGFSSLQPVNQPDSGKSKENVTVTVRFRPLSPREINKGDEIAWYADGESTVRNEYNSSIAYGFDRVFGPATTTRHVYDVAAQHVIAGAMQGINGTVFAYGVTSSGKTHTMHGEQKSPGIIPLAVKDVFGIIQETPGREFLLRVSYLEIYNEVINDLLDPIGQNLRVREDSQGTFVEGIKEEVVLSPAHALSLIAFGEEHRHVGSNNFNLLSSRSHTIFTLTIESSPCGENMEEDVTLSQLNLIDLAGSESSKTETTGLRRKEGSYINKSLLTLGTVISKLTDGKATHVPYRDSKLTRLLQSSLSGHGRVSVICTVTPASSNTEETHNTLKFAHRSKHVEISASQNKIMDEKSLIKKYQKEISSLREELQQLKRGMMLDSVMNVLPQEDLINLKLQMEAGQVQLQSRLEEEEQAKAALMGRIQRLTKLILVSTKNSMSASMPARLSHIRRHSFGEDELAYLPDKKRQYMIEDDSGSYTSELSVDGRDDLTSMDELVKDFKRNRRRGMLDWFKVKKPESLHGSSNSADAESRSSASSASSSKLSQSRVTFSDMKDVRRKSVSRKGDVSAVDSFPERTQAGELFSAAVVGRGLPPTGTTITDQMDLLREQAKMLAGEMALSTSSLKRLSEQAAKNPDNLKLKEHLQRLNNEISEKKRQIHILEQRMIGSLEVAPQASSMIEMFQALSKLTTQLNEKTFELEIKTADNRILQEQLELKTSENADMQETIHLLKQQLKTLTDKSLANQESSVQNNAFPKKTVSEDKFKIIGKDTKRIISCEEINTEESTPTSVMNFHRVFSEDSRECNAEASLHSQVLAQAAEIESLKQEKVGLMEQKDRVEIKAQKLAEEASYAKELASAAAVELRNLAEEVTKLTYENAKLSGDLAAAREASSKIRGVRFENHLGKSSDGALIKEIQRKLDSTLQKKAELETTMSAKDHLEGELRRTLDAAKQREENLENELADMCLHVAKMKKTGINAENLVPESESSAHHKMPKVNGDCENLDEPRATRKLEARCEELEKMVSRLKGEDVLGLDVAVLEELQKLHVEAITKICTAKYANRYPA